MKCFWRVWISKLEFNKKKNIKKNLKKKRYSIRKIKKKENLFLKNH